VRSRFESLLEELDEKVSCSLEWSVGLSEETNYDGGEEDELDSDVGCELYVSLVLLLTSTV
jgi:hypothetical protein